MEKARISGGRISKEYFVDKLEAAPSASIDMRKSVFGREPEVISFGLTQSWFGDCLIATSEYGVCWLDLHPVGSAVQKLQGAFTTARTEYSDEKAKLLGEHVFGDTGEAIPIHLSGTDFQLRVWQALLRIPVGACMSYGQLARCIGEPTAARATGRAIGGNKIAVLVPCHRVLSASGKLGGFRWGPERKQALLQREHIAASGKAQDAA
ncbi:MAG: transcriptional regulator [Chromatiales bacterium]|nr:transcriptional regulator [Chromatiales bacterium]MDP6150035.1 methylated-DNA--[protein]-cysteine S-methyltransferase [Gammaproteobacteria bacterium]MDP7271128.1 methylated-DNA--[protein]-cysteine S-methyltransferase [Gammaproteobacteria bacterium]HJP03984.1 methylated-DNA--[protein]-cysteine S-methyltransferase [Gammaproteobacteria bacterium]